MSDTNHVIAAAGVGGAVSNWVLNYGPGIVTIVAGLIGGIYSCYLIYDLYERRKNRKKPRKR